jgi:tRNA pseudouridine55 synthase
MLLKMRNNNYMKKLEKEGVLLVDKPGGVSSHAVVNWVRRNTGIRKVGHTGTLDPLATGLLIILVGRKFTKTQDSFLKQDKAYVCRARLGITTDSFDIVGNVTGQSDWVKVSKITKDQVLEKMELFKGKINQTVPIYSAVKINGRKLYDFAVKKQEDLLDSLPSREVSIKSFELLGFEVDDDLKTVELILKIDCGSGTYIRSLVNDLGEELGPGATVVELRRTKIGDISLDDALLCPIFDFFLNK